jgi:hypothetical protein
VDEQTRERQIVENERLLREANEEIEREALEDGRQGIRPEETELEFFCTCGRPDCDVRLLLTLAEYESADGRSNRFIVARGHADEAIEDVVEEHDTYVVVEKRIAVG